LTRVGSLLSRGISSKRILEQLADEVVRRLDAERGTIYLLDIDTGELRSLVAHLPEMEEIRLRPGVGIAGWVAQSGQAVRVPDVNLDPRFCSDIDRQTGYRTRNLAAAPVKNREGVVVGVLQVLNKRLGDFTDEDLKLLQELARQTEEVLEHTSLLSPEKGAQLSSPFNHLLGSGPVMRGLFEKLEAACTTDVTVLLRGETGTGKNLAARAIHENSERGGRPFVVVDCAALPPGLIESELFGHERGAFTGAACRVPGKLELAEGGTLLLDEVGELPLELQGKLLRFLQDRTFERVGGRRTLRAEARIIAATNADLAKKVKDGLFRRDLYYRLRVLEIELPPLRVRGRGDILLLARYFLKTYAAKFRRPARRFSKEAEERLLAYDWPGNVRELEHCIEGAVVLCQGEEVAPAQLALPAVEVQTSTGYSPGTPLEQVVADHVRRTVEALGGNRSQAARLLGIGRNTLVRWLKKGSLNRGERK